MTPRLIQRPVAEPLSLAEAKLHLRVDGSDEDSYISSLISVARERCESVTERQLVTAQYRLALDKPPRGREVHLPRPALQSVESVRYVAPDGSIEEVDPDSYALDTACEPGRLVMLGSWPSVAQRPGAITIEYTAGYGEPADVPDAIKHAMRLLIGHWYVNREDVITGTIVSKTPMAADALLGPYITYSPGEP